MRQMIMRLSPSTESPPSASEATPPQSKETGKTNSKENEAVGDGTSKNSSKKDSGKEGYNEVSHVYSLDPPIPHPHIHNRGDPPKRFASTFNQWQFLMKSHVCSFSIELWKIIANGLHVGDPNILTIR